MYMYAKSRTRAVYSTLYHAGEDTVRLYDYVSDSPSQIESLNSGPVDSVLLLAHVRGLYTVDASSTLYVMDHSRQIVSRHNRVEWRANIKYSRTAVRGLLADSSAAGSART